MIYGIDTGFLVAAEVVEHADHSAARAKLAQLSAGGDMIEINSKVLVGKPVVRGTRLAVEFIVELLANTWTEQQIFENYPGITHEDISACLHDATDMLKSERVYLTSPPS